MVGEEQAVQEHTIGSVQELLELLRPSHEFWRGPYKLWGFRGQPDSSWNLVPPAFRPGFGGYVSPDEGETDRETQIRNELAAFEEFVFLADEVRLVVPGTGHLMSEAFNTWRRLRDYWPHPELMEGLALAQHHGTPTRFIDFTYNPLVAAFYAAYHRWTEGSKGCFASNSLSVWAINLHFVHHCYGSAEGRRIDTLNVPAAQNPFLHAQRAFFLWDRLANRYWPPPPIDEVIASRAAESQAWECIERQPKHIRDNIQLPVIRKLIVGHELTQLLLRVLYEQERVSLAHLMPELNSVTNTNLFQRELRETNAAEAQERTKARAT